ncbi:MAG: hypothetical protein SFT68_00950 [Rickettsiaceae bacterium]|nr:hypothetical protein [Rickettsiaceae bacterium]
MTREITITSEILRNPARLREAMKYYTVIIKNPSGTIINLEELTPFFEGLKNNTNITFIDLSNNKIGALGARVIATAIKQNHTLTSIDLSNNKIGVSGAVFIADILAKKTL